MTSHPLSWANRHDGECESANVNPPDDEFCRCYVRWLEGRLTEANKAWAAAVAKCARDAEAFERDKESWQYTRGCLLEQLRVLLPPKGAGDE